jgi:soluble lytic murein transglycosylase-like protein
VSELQLPLTPLTPQGRGHRVIRSARALALAAALLLVPGVARAQIYSWQDANGSLVLSNRPQPGTEPLRSYAVPRADAVRATRPAAAARTALYDGLIAQHAHINDVRVDLVRAVVQVESGFNPDARSPKGAMGLMQLMPATAREFGVTNAFNPSENVRAGVAYLRQLLDRYQNNEVLALAAYNAGPGAVDKHGQSVPPYRETQHYVSQVNSMAASPIAVRGRHIFKVTETVDGRAAIRYTDTRPPSGFYEVVASR